MKTGDCFESENLIPLGDLIEKHNLPVGQFLNYEALSRAFQALWRKGTTEPQTHRVLQLVLMMADWGHKVKWLYGALTDMVRKPIYQARAKWEAVIERRIEDKPWETVQAYSQTISRNTRLKYIQFNYLHQTYLTPKRITRIYGGEPRNCPRCARGEADFGHMVWSCANIQEYWDKVLRCIQAATGSRLQTTAEVCLLGIFPRNKKTKVGNKFMDLALALAKRCIAMSWKSPLGPNVDRWRLDVQLWAEAEEQALRKEEIRGLRKDNISTDWAVVLHAFSQGEEEETEALSLPEEQ